MAKNKELEFLKSNYTLRTKHKKLSNGSSIYERDYMVTSNLGGFNSVSIPNGESNFKMVTRTDVSSSRKHNYGTWLKNGDSDTWTLDAINKAKNSASSNTGSTTDVSSSFIPNYTSLLDFAYFGNCTEMIKSSVSDIISKYPGEMYVSDRNIEYYNEHTKTYEILGSEIGDLVEIENPYSIDVYSKYLTKDQDLSITNKLPYFCKSRDKYKILDSQESPVCIDNRWILQIDDYVLRCHYNGDYIGRVLIAGDYDPSISKEQNLSSSAETQFVIYLYYANDKLIYLTDRRWSYHHIRPIDSAFNEFYNGLDDFEKFLLNKNSNPIYTIRIDAEKETDEGIVKYEEKLTWPTIYGWNLDTESVIYKSYLEKLLTLSEYYDEKYSDNLWRMMTHDSIKNMDLTFKNTITNEDKTDYNIGTTKVQGLFWAYGRLFDDLLRQTDNVEKINSVGYSSIGSVSESTLTNKLELNGWETHNPTETLDSESYADYLYPNSVKKYGLTETNQTFYTYLLLNSKSVFSRKGTRAGIEMLMSLFGYCSYDFARQRYKMLPNNKKILDKFNKPISWEKLDKSQRAKLYDYELNEYVVTVSNTSGDVVDSDVQLDMETYNTLRKDFNGYTEGDTDMLSGLPAKDVVFSEYDEDGNISYKHYIIPWFSKTEEYNGDMYFQMYGGWGNVSFKKISQDIAPNVTELISGADFKIYSETKKYIKYRSKISDLLKVSYDEIENGDIYYINDISDYNDYISGTSGVSNYFIIKNKENHLEISDDGWINIPVNDIEEGIRDGLKVLYIESIVDDNKGNNPHIGYGKYDGGEEYLNYFKQIFKYYIDNDTEDEPLFYDEAYVCETGKLNDGILKCGFTVSDYIKDNMKVWYFNQTGNDGINMLQKNYQEGEDSEGNIYEVPVGMKQASFTDTVEVGKKSVQEGQTELSTDLSAFNLETQEYDSNDEAAANSIINVKKLEIKFNYKYASINGFEEYLYNVIVPYLYQVIPSTSISNILIDGVKNDMTCYQYPEITGTVCDEPEGIFTEEFDNEFV